MNHVALVHDLALAIAGLGAALGFLDGPYPWLAGVGPLAAIAAFIAQRKGWNWATGVAWLLLMSLSAASLLLGARILIPLTTGASALVAWDLAAFQEWVGAAPVHGANDRLESLARAHLRRLLPVAILGWLLGVAASLIRIRIGFYPILLLGAIVAFGLNQLLRFLRRESS